MTSSKPTVSVSMITYNQAPFIRDSIRSVLGQTFGDLELVVLDDGSTDDTARAVAEFTDPRLVYIRQENQGPGGAAVAALAACRGRYVALMTGDDLCHPERLARQLDAHRRGGGGVVFSNVDYIDEEGRPLEHAHFPKDYFAIPPMSQAQVLERLFFQGNFIHTVTLFAELQALRDAGPEDPLLIQLMDYDRLIRLAKKHRFHFLPESTFSWRIRARAGNLSAPAPLTQVRTMNEYYLVLLRFFDGMPAEQFQEVFRGRLVRPDSRSPAELACEQALLYLHHPHFPLCRLIGVEKLYGLLQAPETRDLLADRYGVPSRAYVDLLRHADPLNLLEPCQTFLFIDTGSGFRGEECLRQTANHSLKAFRLEFDLSGFPAVRELRWDPVRFRNGTVALSAVGWTDGAGRRHSLPLERVRANGWRAADGASRFENQLPSFFLPVAGEVRTLTLEGVWDVYGREASAVRTDALLREQERVLREQEHRLREIEHRRAVLESELVGIYSSRKWRLVTRLASVLRRLPFRRAS